MINFFQLVDQFLRGRGTFSVDRPAAGRVKYLLLFVLVFGTLYGAVMGTFTGMGSGRQLQLLYSGIKVPLLLLVTFLLCLPSFFVVNTLLGLWGDFGKALNAVLSAQACIAVVLVSLAPLTLFFYLSTNSYRLALFFNGLVFAAASISGLFVIRRYYRPLIERKPVHKIMLYFWLFFYIFVGIQMSWVLRPFIGSPDLPVAFFRKEAWGNAYVVVANLIGDIFRILFQ